MAKSSKKTVTQSGLQNSNAKRNNLKQESKQIIIKEWSCIICKNASGELEPTWKSKILNSGLNKDLKKRNAATIEFVMTENTPVARLVYTGISVTDVDNSSDDTGKSGKHITKKQKISTDSSDDSSSEKIEQPARESDLVPKNVTKTEESSSDSTDDSSDEDMEEVKNKVLTKKSVAKKRESSSSESDDDAAKKTVVTKKNVSKKQESSSSDSDDDTSDDEPAKKTVLAKKNVSKKQESSSSDSDDDSSDDEPAKKTVLAKKNVSKKQESSSSDSDDDSSDDELAKKPIAENKTSSKKRESTTSDSSDKEMESPKKRIVEKKKVAKKQASSSSDSDADSSEEKLTQKKVLAKKSSAKQQEPTSSDSEDEKTAPTKKIVSTKKSATKKKVSSSSESSDNDAPVTFKGNNSETSTDSSEETKKKRSATTEVNRPLKKFQTDGTEEKFEVFAGGWPVGSTEDEIKKVFEESCGSVIRVKMLGQGGASFVQFAEASGVDAALEWNNTEYKGRKLTINKAGDKPNTLKKSNDIPNATVIVRNIPFNATETDIQNLLSDCGEICSVKTPVFQDTGKPRGFAMVNFSSSKEAAAAVKLSGASMTGREVTIELARPRENNGGNQSNNRGGSGFRGSRGSGRGGGRGGRMGGGNKPMIPTSAGAHTVFED